MANDNTGEFMSMAERAAESALRNTASILGLPVYHVHRNLDEKSLRALCITVASEALALYAKKQLVDYEAQRADLDHPGC
jgi:hypothetical protein